MRTSLKIRCPDDWHVHLREGQILPFTVSHTATRFARAIVMPNLIVPVVTAAQAMAYRDTILAVLNGRRNTQIDAFEPLMTTYMTDDTNPQDIADGFHRHLLYAVKLYPAHATTNSAHGVTDIRRVYPVLETMQRHRVPLLIHGEVTDKDVDIYDREAVFIERTLSALVRDFPQLPIVLEHITTDVAAAFVQDRHQTAPGTIGATITPHHLTINRTHMFEGGIRPHLYCLPIAKRDHHRLALRKAATSGLGPFFLGTDSAPHLRHHKETSCGCAGIFNAPSALNVYATVFEEENALDRLEAFASLNGPAFYRLPVNTRYMMLEKTPTQIPPHYPTHEGEVVPFCAGETLAWRVKS